MSIAQPSQEFIYDEYMEGRGKKDIIKMKKTDFLKEHKHLIELLTEVSKKLSAEASDQSEEMKKQGGGCCKMCSLIGGMDLSLEQSEGGGQPNYELHAVVIHKPVDLEEAKRLASNFIEKKKHFYRETASSYRFRNIPKTQFKKKSFRTKVVNKQISLIYGELEGKKGAGIKDTLSNIYNRVKRNPFGIGIAEYCGPNTDLSSDRAPTSKTDAICKTHDYDYNAIGKRKQEGATQEELARLTREADTKMLEALKTVKEDKIKDKLIHFIANSGISLKTKLEDMGLLNPTRFSASGKPPKRKDTIEYLEGRGIAKNIGSFIYRYMLLPYYHFLKQRAKDYVKENIDKL